MASIRKLGPGIHARSVKRVAGMLRTGDAVYRHEFGRGNIHPYMRQGRPATPLAVANMRVYRRAKAAERGSPLRRNAASALRTQRNYVAAAYKRQAKTSPQHMADLHHAVLKHGG